MLSALRTRGRRLLLLLALDLGEGKGCGLLAVWERKDSQLQLVVDNTVAGLAVVDIGTPAVAVVVHSLR